jgi:hypothetical protein
MRQVGVIANRFFCPSGVVVEMLFLTRPQGQKSPALEFVPDPQFTLARGRDVCGKIGQQFLVRISVAMRRLITQPFPLFLRPFVQTS